MGKFITMNYTTNNGLHTRTKNSTSEQSIHCYFIATTKTTILLITLLEKLDSNDEEDLRKRSDILRYKICCLKKGE